MCTRPVTNPALSASVALLVDTDSLRKQCLVYEALHEQFVHHIEDPHDGAADEKPEGNAHGHEDARVHSRNDLG